MKFNLGDKIKCVEPGEQNYCLMHSLRNRLVKGKIYTVCGIFEYYGEQEVFLNGKSSSWQSKRFIKIK